MASKEKLTVPKLIEEAQHFCLSQSKFQHKELFGVTDGKAVGTLIEQKFQKHLSDKYEVTIGSSASGIDLPSDDILTDIKVTSIKQPQSPCPFKDAKQKIFGLGYNLLVFVYDKTDNPSNKTATLNFVSCSFVSKERTADYTTTYRLREMVQDGANEEDIIGFLQDKNIPTDGITLMKIAEQILQKPPEQGYLTISNALQWRLRTGLMKGQRAHFLVQANPIIKFLDQPHPAPGTYFFVTVLIRNKLLHFLGVNVHAANL